MPQVPSSAVPGEGVLPRGIVSVVQTPFAADGAIDSESLERLVEDAIVAQVDGLLAPVVASEVAHLTDGERREIVRRVSALARGRVPFIIGASSPEPAQCRSMISLGESVGAVACLIAVPDWVYDDRERLVSFFREAVGSSALPLVVQDFQWGGQGLEVGQIVRLREGLRNVSGIKIETLPAGPKYTAVRERLGARFYIAGGWAVTQMIEALDRGVDAMIPESSMIRVYHRVHRLHQAGHRDRARQLFQRLSPVLAFTNQDLATSIAFFKRLLARKRIFGNPALRVAGFAWDAYNTRIADELIDHYLALESQVGAEDV